MPVLAAGDRRALRAALDLVAPGLGRRARHGLASGCARALGERRCARAAAFRARRGPCSRSGSFCASTSPSCSGPASASRCFKGAAPGARRRRPALLAASIAGVLAFGSALLRRSAAQYVLSEGDGRADRRRARERGRAALGDADAALARAVRARRRGALAAASRSTLRARESVRAGALRLRPRRRRRLAEGLSQPLRRPGRDVVLRTTRGSVARDPRAPALDGAPRGAGRSAGARRLSLLGAFAFYSPIATREWLWPTTPTLWWNENRDERAHRLLPARRRRRPE